jgi:hypothetical protein
LNGDPETTEVEAVEPPTAADVLSQVVEQCQDFEGVLLMIRVQRISDFVYTGQVYLRGHDVFETVMVEFDRV